jgi:hypothetical protein
MLVYPIFFYLIEEQGMIICSYNVGLFVDIHEEAAQQETVR